MGKRRRRKVTDAKRFIALVESIFSIYGYQPSDWPDDLEKAVHKGLSLLVSRDHPAYSSSLNSDGYVGWFAIGEGILYDVSFFTPIDPSKPYGYYDD